MGYESKIYIVEKTGIKVHELGNKKRAEVIAVFNMSKFPPFNDYFKTETDCFIYADDGNTKILKDEYAAL